MKVLVTGGQGVLGSSLIKRMKERGIEATSYDIKSGQDILNFEALCEATGGVDVVVHCAAYPNPSAIPDLMSAFNVNILGTFNVAEACKKCEVKKLIFTSSTSYYGLENSLHAKLPFGDWTRKPFYMVAPADDKYDEKELAYGVTKVCSEAILSIYGLKKTFQVIIFRLAPFLGHHLDFFVPIEKVVEVIISAIELPGPLWCEVFNICSDGDMSTEKAERILGFRREYEK